MDLDVVGLSRLQFALTALYHFLFVPLTLGLSMLVYATVVNEDSRNTIGAMFVEAGIDPTHGVQAVAAIVALLAGALASWFPSWGTRILPIMGLFTIVWLMRDLILDAPQKSELWPVALGGAVFFYLWRVTALLFDLVFVWHRYVRHAAARHSIAQVCDKGYEPTALEKLTDAVGPKPAATSVGAK